MLPLALLLAAAPAPARRGRPARADRRRRRLGGPPGLVRRLRPDVRLLRHRDAGLPAGRRGAARDGHPAGDVPDAGRLAARRPRSRRRGGRRLRAGRRDTLDARAAGDGGVGGRDRRPVRRPERTRRPVAGAPGAALPGPDLLRHVPLALAGDPRGGAALRRRCPRARGPRRPGRHRAGRPVLRDLRAAHPQGPGPGPVPLAGGGRGPRGQPGRGGLRDTAAAAGDDAAGGRQPRARRPLRPRPSRPRGWRSPYLPVSTWSPRSTTSPRPASRARPTTSRCASG